MAEPVSLTKPEKSSAERSGQVQSLVRALRLLQEVADAGDGITLTEVANRVGLPVSSAHRLLSTLQQEGFVRFDAERTLWFVGVKAFAVGNAFLRARDLVQVARPYMRGLMEQCDETVNLAVEDGGQIIYLAQIECRQMMRALASPGARVPMHSSAVGKVLLAYMSPAVRNSALDRLRLERFTANTITGRERLEKGLGEIRVQGYAFDDEEHAVGLRCVAAPIFNEAREAIAGISLSGPAARVTDKRFNELAGLVQRTAKVITRDFGGIPPDAIR
ncbi:MAG TPA: IclR family transcriptional regulator C-terminal domain-containing protein [Alphaproteobacteria bacterium]|nr:IclR family transcriptional regulator C-terminal domain-containing protein [Alphaproteobacteria bacterium]